MVPSPAVTALLSASLDRPNRKDVKNSPTEQQPLLAHVLGSEAWLRHGVAPAREPKASRAQGGTPRTWELGGRLCVARRVQLGGRFRQRRPRCELILWLRPRPAGTQTPASSSSTFSKQKTCSLLPRVSHGGATVELAELSRRLPLTRGEGDPDQALLCLRV